MGLKLSEETEAWLKSGAEAAVHDGDHARAQHFLAALELAYLVASADGLADEERELLALALADATGAVVDREGFSRHFRDLDDAVEALGQPHRLGAAASVFESPHQREEAIQFAAVIAMADQKLDPKELAVLEEVARLFDWPSARVHALVEGLR